MPDTQARKAPNHEIIAPGGIEFVAGLLRFARRDALEKLSVIVLYASVGFLDSSAPCSMLSFH